MTSQAIATLLSKPLKAPVTEQQCLSILGTLLAAFGCKTGSIHSFNQDSQLLELRAQQGIPAVLLDKVSRIPLGKGIAGAAANKREAVQMCNLQTDTSGVARPDAKKTQVAGSVAVPILSGETLKGAIGIGKHTPYDFTESEVELLNTVAEWLAEAL